MIINAQNQSNFTQNRTNLIENLLKPIKNQHNHSIRIWFWHWIFNQTEFDIWTWMVWNPNSLQFDFVGPNHLSLELLLTKKCRNELAEKNKQEFKLLKHV